MRIAIGTPNLLHYPEGGGHWSWVLQYPLSLRALGHEVLLIATTETTGSESTDAAMAATFRSRLAQYGFGDDCCVIVHDRGSQPDIDHPIYSARTRDWILDCDALWNIACSIRQPLLNRFRWRVLLDVDPGHLQVSALSWDLGIEDHDRFLTVGLNMGKPSCSSPTLGVEWHTFYPLLYLDFWPCRPDPGARAPMSSLTHWNWDELEFRGSRLSLSKREAYLPLLDLPRLTNRPFLLSANLGDADGNTGDRRLLEEAGWQVCDPLTAAGTPEAYRDFIAESRAEICAPKAAFRELATGWFSDRSAAYLATGRPVLMGETGFGDALPTGRGLLLYSGVEDAALAVSEIDSDYAEHSRAARVIAEQFCAHQVCLPRIIALAA